jgi:hypothetical protein
MKKYKLYGLSFLTLLIMGFLLLVPFRAEFKRFIGKKNIDVAKYAVNVIFNKMPTNEENINSIYLNVNKFLKGDLLNKQSYLKDNVNFDLYQLQNIFPGKHPFAINSSYIDFYNEDLILMSATGILIRYNIKGPNIKPQIINSNFNKFSNYRDFNTESNFGVKDILILDDEIYVSFTEKDVNNGYNTSVVKSKISNQLDFKYVLKSQQFIYPNKIPEFNSHQSGGRIVPFKKDSILISVGEYRDRSRAQDDLTINGKIIAVHKENGGYRIVSKGHRNPQGLSYDSDKDIILSSEHGPAGGDEINLQLDSSIKLNFGWPISSYGTHYDLLNKYGEHTSDEKRLIEGAPLHKSHEQYGFIEPIKYFDKSPGLSQVLLLDFDNNKFDFLVSTLGTINSPYIKSLMYMRYETENNRLSILKHIKIGERIRDMVIDKDKNLWAIGETTGVILKTELNNIIDN